MLAAASYPVSQHRSPALIAYGWEAGHWPATASTSPASLTATVTVSCPAKSLYLTEDLEIENANIS